MLLSGEVERRQASKPEDASHPEFTATLRLHLAQAQTALHSHKRIDRAKGILMQQRGLTEDEAHRLLRKLAMDRGEKLAATAERVIDAHALLGGSGGTP